MLAVIQNARYHVDYRFTISTPLNRPTRLLFVKRYDNEIFFEQIDILRPIFHATVPHFGFRDRRVARFRAVKIFRHRRRLVRQPLVKERTKYVRFFAILVLKFIKVQISRKKTKN